MRFTSSTLALIVLAGTANAFQSPQASHSRHSASAGVRRSNSRIISSLNMAEDGMSEVEKLRAAAARARKEADETDSELYQNRIMNRPASPMRTSAAARSSSSEYSDYGTQDVYWSDVNGFPQDVVYPEAMPSMDDMRNGMGGGRMNADDHVYSPDKYYPHQDSPNPGSSSSKFEDIPFQPNENYSRKFQRNTQREGLNNNYDNMHGGMNGEFGQRPMDRPYSPDIMMGQGRGYGGGPVGVGGYGTTNNNGMHGDFPSLMNEIMPPPGGMGMMGDPYSPYGQQQGYGGGYGGHPYGRMEQPGMMMGVDMDMHHHGDFGFQGGMGGMGPGGCEEFGGPHDPGGAFGQQQQ